MHKRLWWWILSLSVLTLFGVFAWTNRYNIYDWVALRNYSPPADVARIAETSGMGDYGKRLFYVNKPELSNKQQFAAQCNNKEQTIVLGCYNGVNIYIFDVTEPTLEGVEEVTAAHEMLHAAYDRLSSSEKQKVDQMVEQAFKRVNNPRIMQLAETYRKQDPSVVPNELHSILGSEVRNLGSELETYYSKYFADRLKVVSLSEQYEKVFESLKANVEKLDGDLAIRKSEIEKLEQSLESRGKALNAQKTQMDSLLASGRTSAYNAQVNSYNASVNDYNSDIARLKLLINDYNSLVEQRNAIAVQQENLAKSIDSRLDTISN